MSAQTAAVLDVACDLLDRDGWRQGIRPVSAKDNDRRRCPLVAIAEADLDHGGQTRFMDAAHAFRAVIGWESVTEWNDAPGRRVSEVLDAFTAAANRERGTG
jgi:hypothetical protein